MLGAFKGNAHFDPIILLLIAMAIEGYIGGAGALFRRVPHPVVLIGRAINFFDQKLNRDWRSTVDRAVRGAVTVVLLITAAGAMGAVLMWLTFHQSFGWAAELFLVVTLIAGRGLFDAVAGVAKALETGTLEDGQAAVSHIVGRDPATLDEGGVARAAVESLAENFSDAYVAPVFWYVLMGLPGLLIYKTVNTLDSMIGHRTPRHQAFGFTAARLDDALNAVPARLSALINAVGAMFVPTANPRAAIAAAFRDAGKHRSFNAGWPEAAMAGALGLALAGPRRYDDHIVEDAWMGDGRARLTAKDIRRALYLYAVACLLTGGIVAAIAVLRLEG